MRLRSIILFALVIGVLTMSMVGCEKKATTETNKVLMVTSMGEIELELYPDKAPIGVENFLTYVREKFYDNTIFHRVINGFMIQGGGFSKNHEEKDGKYPPIENEAKNGLSNVKGTLSYARTNVINSATSQWFINHVDNVRLDHQNETPAGFGYAVFGKVIRGMDVVEAIAKVPVADKPLKFRHEGNIHEHVAQNVPIEPVVLKSVRIVME